MNYLGDFKEDSTHQFLWNTHIASGASATRATDGTLYVYQAQASGTETTVGITDDEDHDGLTGVHCCTIDTSAAAFYATGYDYHVVLKAATIDGQVVNACIAEFSIENRTSSLTASALANLIKMFDAAGGGLAGSQYPARQSDTDAIIASGNAGWVTAEGFSTLDQAALNAQTNTLIASGDANWATATSFASTADVTGARDVVIASGNAAWATAEGFSTLNQAALDALGVTIIASGDANWATATDVNVTQIGGQAVNSNAGTNWMTFFDNASGVTTKLVDNVGAVASGAVGAQDIIDIRDAVWAATTIGASGTASYQLWTAMDAIPVTIVAAGTTGWTTAQGFSTAADVTAARDAIVASGTAGWTTAQGFSTLNQAALDALGVTIIASGDAGWTTAQGFSTLVQTDLDTQTTTIVASGTAGRAALAATLAAYGDLNWATADGFSTLTTADLDALGVTIIASGDANWLTATSCATVADLTAQTAAIVASGDANWTTAEGFSTLAQADLDTQTATLIASGDANWATATNVNVTQLMGTTLSGTELANNWMTFYANGGSVTTKLVDNVGAVASGAVGAQDIIDIRDAVWAATTIGASGTASYQLWTAMDAIPGTVIAAGNVAWTTATSFATVADLTAQTAAIVASGDAGWTTAEGFSTLAQADLDTQTAALVASGDANWATAQGFSTLTASGVRDAVGMDAADLDTQLATILASGGGGGDVNVTQIAGVAVNSNAGTNWMTFFDNAAALTTRTVDHVGAVASGSVSAQDITDIRDAVWQATASGNIVSGMAGYQLWTALDGVKNNTDLIQTATITTTAPTATDGTITLIRGDTYSGSRVLSWTDAAQAADLTGATVRFHTIPYTDYRAATGEIEITAVGTIIPLASGYQYDIPLTSDQTAALTPNVRHTYDVEITASGGEVQTPIIGRLNVTSDVRTES
jgi:hypothetical protein